MGFTITLFTAKIPSVLSKAFKLGPEGKLVKIPGGQLVDGIAERLTFNRIDQFSRLLSDLEPHNALAFGLPAHQLVRIVPQARLKDTPNGEHPVIARTREAFQFSSGPGIMMLDIDAPKNGDHFLNPKEAFKVLDSVCPALESCPHILTHSTSSHIWLGDKELIGQRGLRIYVLVAEAEDIHRAGRVLYQRLWLAGHGRIEVSKAGTMLDRTTIDAAVFSPERLDFAGGAACEAPLQQRRPDPIAYNTDAKPLDTRRALRDLSLTEMAGLKEKIAKVKANPAVRATAEAQKQIWIDTRISTHLEKRGLTPESNRLEAASVREIYTQAARHQVLYSDFELILPDRQTIITVGEILDKPDKWHNQRFADPLEPGCYEDWRISWANLRTTGRPYIYSHAHGGQKYTLSRARREIRIDPGERVQIVNRSLELMREDGSIFQRGGEIVRVGKEGEIIPLDKGSILLTLDRLARWMKYSKTAKDWVPVDCPPAMAEGVLATRGDWNLPCLTGVITAPVMDVDSGRIIDEEGLDQRTGLLLTFNHTEQFQKVPANPSKAQLQDALATLWEPFREFPFKTCVDKGVMLAAILTSIVRLILRTAPAFMFTAPTAGSGKTLLTKSLSSITGQQTPTIVACADKDEEIRKRLFALGRLGSSSVIMDNLSGILESDALCAWLTAEVFSDRVLGKSHTIAVPTRTLFMLTGNNVQLRGDLCRRVLPCRIDPEVETPWKRGFSLDPVQHCRKHRLEIVSSGLTILRAATLQIPPPADRTASFESWSDSVRRAVILVRDLGLLDVEDPIKAIDQAYAHDPDTAQLRAILTAWEVVFENQRKTIAEVVEAHNFIKNGGQNLKAALEDVAGESGNINHRRLGRYLVGHEGRIINGLRIEGVGSRNGSRVWQLRRV